VRDHLHWKRAVYFLVWQNEISMSPYVQGKEKKNKKKSKVLFVIITSNRGLCGAYNMNVFREVLKQAEGVKAECITIGKKAREFVVRTGHTPRLLIILKYFEMIQQMHRSELSLRVSVSSISMMNIQRSELSTVSIFLLLLRKLSRRPFLPVSTDTLSAFLEEITGSVISPLTYSGEYKPSNHRDRLSLTKSSHSSSISCSTR
jgi:F0F1-type ATP synthase gamma subunit